jgi:hypothetical protein
MFLSKDMLIEREQSIVACARGILLDAVAAENREAGWKFWQRSTTTTKGNVESNQAVEAKCEYCLPGHANHRKSKGRHLPASLKVGKCSSNTLTSCENWCLLISGYHSCEICLYLPMLCKKICLLSHSPRRTACWTWFRLFSKRTYCMFSD